MMAETLDGTRAPRASHAWYGAAPMARTSKQSPRGPLGPPGGFARALATLLLAGGCHAPAIATIPCVVNSDCGEGQVCNSAYQCVSPPPVRACGPVPDAGPPPPFASVPPNDVIDDFEHDDGLIYPREGRSGTWFIANDGSGTQSPAAGMPALPETRPDGTGNRLLHTSGQPFSEWGALVAASLARPAPVVAGENYQLADAGSGATTPSAYDAHAHTGIRFTYASSVSVSLLVATLATVPAPWGTCMSQSQCNGQFGKGFPPSPDLRTVVVRWGDLTQNWGAIAAFDPSQIVDVQWEFPANAPFDFWLDDVAFVDDEEVDASCPAPSTLPRSIDDFVPNDRDVQFGPWEAFAISTSAPVSLINLAPDQSGIFFWTRAMPPGRSKLPTGELDWQLTRGTTDPPPGAGFASSVVPGLAFVDLSEYGSIEFSHFYEPVGTCEAIPGFTVGFDCPQRQTSFSKYVPTRTDPTDWATQPTRVPFSQFSESLNTTSGISVRDCLALTNAISFFVESPSVDATCGAGHLYVTDITLR
jgi:hypothetical protein